MSAMISRDGNIFLRHEHAVKDKATMIASALIEARVDQIGPNRGQDYL